MHSRCPKSCSPHPPAPRIHLGSRKARPAPDLFWLPSPHLSMTQFRRQSPWLGQLGRGWHQPVLLSTGEGGLSPSGQPDLSPSALPTGCCPAMEEGRAGLPLCIRGRRTFQLGPSPGMGGRLSLDLIHPKGLEVSLSPKETDGFERSPHHQFQTWVPFLDHTAWSMP